MDMKPLGDRLIVVVLEDEEVMECVVVLLGPAKG